MADKEQNAPTIQINISFGTDGTPNLKSPAAVPTAPQVDFAAPDSPAWNPDAHEIGHQWATHESRAKDTNSDRRFELRRIYHNLFTINVDLTSDKKPFREIQKLQELLYFIDPNDPGKKLTSLNNVVDRNGKPLENVTVVDALNTWLAPLNDDKKATLTFSQYVLLWHVFRNQDDLKLLSPWEVPDKYPFT